MTHPTQGSTPSDGATAAFPVRGRVAFGVLVILGLTLGVGGWAATAELSGAVVASGSIVVDRNVKQVQHQYGGVVSAIYVKNGDRVAAGQVLLELDPIQTRAEYQIVRSRIAEFSLRSERLLAEIADRERFEVPDVFFATYPEAAAALDGERKLFEDNRRSRKSQKEQLELQITQLKEEIAGTKAQLASKETQSELIGRELSQVQQLLDKKLTSVNRLYALQREAGRLEGEAGGLRAQVARSEGRISEIRVKMLGMDQDVRLEAQKELRDLETKLAELREREVAMADRLTRTKLLAPQSGVVHELAAHTVGGVITGAQTVALIVPDEEALTIEARVNPVDIDQVTLGRMAHLRFSAFNQRTTPELVGQVALVSADATSDDKTGQRYYLARVSVELPELSKLDGLKLLPGMPVEVFVSTGTRTALSYFTKPITDQFQRVFREE